MCLVKAEAEWKSSKSLWGRHRYGDRGRCGHIHTSVNMYDSYIVQERRWEDVYDEVAAREMELFNTLADGSALEQV